MGLHRYKTKSPPERTPCGRSYLAHCPAMRHRGSVIAQRKNRQDTSYLLIRIFVSSLFVVDDEMNRALIITYIPILTIAIKNSHFWLFSTKFYFRESVAGVGGR